MAKRSPQSRYQAALRAIKARTGITHKTAQVLYRLQRERVGERAKFPTWYDRTLRASEIEAAAEEAKRAVQLTLFAHADSENRAGDFSFDVRDLHREIIEERIAAATDRKHVTLRVTVSLYRGGKLLEQITVERQVSTNPTDFWPTYHDMVRDTLEGYYTDGQGGDDPISTVTDDIAIVE